MALLQADTALNDRPPEDSRPDDMVWIPGGTFRMGSDRHYPEEAPAHRVSRRRLLDRPHAGDQPPIQAFVKATGHVTFAEIAARCRGLSRRLAADANAGSLVFTPPRARRRPARLEPVVDIHERRRLAPSLRPEQHHQRLDDHPVVHVAYRRRQAYARWAGKESADRSGMGICRARRARRRRIRLGRRIHARRQAHGQYLAGRISAPEPRPRTASSAHRRSGLFRPTATACTT